MDNIKWEDTDLYTFTKEHKNCNKIKLWGGYTNKDSGYIPWGYQIFLDEKIYYFNLEGRFIKEKVL